METNFENDNHSELKNRNQKNNFSSKTNTFGKMTKNRHDNK